ncbi:MAG: ectonucleotide pyrophosphatase/phosphodiesterase [Myxococcota bacterium]
MIRARRLAVLALALAACAWPRAEADGAERPVVILLSWDGTRHDYPERAEARGLARLQREGARAERLVPVFPSSTFPNHVSLATGTYVDRHGIIGNRFTDRAGRSFDYSNDASWIEAEPLWIAAERQGVRAAVYFWVGSETDWRGRGATYRRAPFDASIGEAAKVDQILAWLDLPAEQRPGLIMAWWHGCDHVGHEQGPDSPSIAAQLVAQDAQLERLLAGLDERKAWDHTTLLVASDHGMTELREAVDAQDLLAKAGIRARVELAGGEAQVHLQDLAQRDAALAALAKAEGLAAYTAESLPPSYRSHFPGRSGELTVVASPPRVLSRTRKARGGHGYDPELPDMGAIFFALGRGVPKAAKLGTVRAIDIAPTAAALLAIDPPAQSEGKALFNAH